MRTFQSCLCADFRRVLPLLPWLLGLHALVFGVRARWADDMSDQLIGMIEWSPWALALLVGIISLWADAPLRRERYLATRPQEFPPLLAAKLVALLLIVALPCALVECFTLRAVGISGAWLGLGTMQVFLFALAVVAALFPLVWWWRTPTAAFSGTGITLAVLILASVLLARQTGNRFLYGGEYLRLPFCPYLTLVSCAVFSLVATTLLPLLKGWPDPVRCAVFCGAAVTGLASGLWVSIRPPQADARARPALVELGVEQHPDKIHACLPCEEMPGMDVVWTYSRLTVDGKDIRPWREDMMWQFVDSNPMQNALVARFGKDISMPSGEKDPKFWPAAILPGGYISGGSHDIDMEALETRYQWEIAAELPLKAGAVATLPGFRCEIKFPGNDQARRGERMKNAVVVDTQVCDRWLGRQAGPSHASSMVACVVDPGRGTVNAFTNIYDDGAAAPGISSLRRVRISWLTDELVRANTSLDQLLLVIIRPHVITRIAHAWKSADKVPLSDAQDLPYPLRVLLRQEKPPPGEASRRSPQSRTNAELMSQFVAHGRAGELAEDARYLARNGMAWKMTPILLAVPAKVGLTEDEWMDYFRLHTDPQTYRALRTICAKDRLDHVVDQQLSGFRVRPLSNSCVVSLELALLRGMAAGPGWLKELMLAETKRDGALWSWSDQLIDRYFTPPAADPALSPADVRTMKARWFLAADPARFTHDEAACKYQLQPSP